jgi:hypothetical protein
MLKNTITPAEMARALTDEELYGLAMEIRAVRDGEASESPLMTALATSFAKDTGIHPEQAAELALERVVSELLDRWTAVAALKATQAHVAPAHPSSPTESST